MCDDLTETDNSLYLARRDVAKLGAGAGLAAMLGGYATAAMGADTAAGAADAPALPVTSAMVDIPTLDGTADAFFVHPVSGRHPAVILWPDVAGLRPAYQQMATRLAGAGYAVLAVNQYYRRARSPVLSSFAEWRSEAGRARLQPMINDLIPWATMRDADSFVSWLDAQPSVDVRREIGSAGYCMGGPHAFRTAAASAGRVGAIASFHGGGLVTDAGDSPHRLMERFSAIMLIAIAQNDHDRRPGDKDALIAEMEATDRPGEVEVYPAQHGWCTIDSPVFDAVQAERAWGRMLAIFGEGLQGRTDAA
jgi:carboxymethylenebutenolidase